MLSPDQRGAVAARMIPRALTTGDVLTKPGVSVEGLHVVMSGGIALTDADGQPMATLGPGDTLGARALLGDGRAILHAGVTRPGTLLLLPADAFRDLIAASALLHGFFSGERPAHPAPRSLAEMPVAALMTPAPRSVRPDSSLAEAAATMRDAGISSLLVVEDERLAGILTLRDLSGRVVAERMDPDAPVSHAMTREPITLPPDAIGSDVLHLMMERGIGHVPIVATADRTGRAEILGIVTQTDLTRYQAESSADIIGDAARAPDVAALAAIAGRVPRLLAQLTGAGTRHDTTTRLVTDVADAVTRRLLALAEARLGPPPVPYLWLACGSQGRQEQTGKTDQDNVLMLSDNATAGDDAYFAELANDVSRGLDQCGYVFCPGNMMATNPRWRQPVRVWREYFRGWIARPDKEAQMLASVMFDLRPIGGETSLHAGLQAETLDTASRNSIFVAHMISNAAGHHPPLGLWRGFATIRAGEHRDRIDLKLNGVVPVVDLGRIYALRGRIAAVNTRARLVAARAAGIISAAGGSDLLDAYDLIAQVRLDHQAAQVRRGERPDNFMAPGSLGAFERNHLRDAFLIVRTMQSAAAQGGGPLR